MDEKMSNPLDVKLGLLYSRGMPSSQHKTFLQRFSDVVLDPKGATYGDERERSHWLSAIAVTWTIQTLLTALVLAVAVWAAPSIDRIYLWGFWAAIAIPSVLCLALVHQQRVETPMYAGSPGSKAIQILFGIIYSVATIGLTVGADVRDGLPTRQILGGAFGGIVGGGAVVVLIWFRNRKLRLAALAEDDE
jgi:hypothetical protein